MTDDYVPLDTWDACYRRGISCMEGECWEYAIEEFNRAIQLSFEDERNVRAYGMHFRDEYFPHRELGITYFYLYLSELKKDPGKLEKAIYELKLSIDQTPSARAKYYLNQARRSHLLATGRDVLPPAIHLEWAQDEYLASLEQTQDEYLANQTPFKITGTVKDDHFTAAVSVNDAPLFIELAEEEIPFAYPVDLEEGWNRIEIIARDLVDKEVKKSIRVYLDRQGPLVISNPIQEDQIPVTGQITVSALIYDRSGIISFKLNNREVPRYGLDELCFIEERISLPPGLRSIPFLTQDRAGNIAGGEISVIPSRRRRKQALRLACLDRDDHLTYPAMTAKVSEEEDISLKIIYPEIKDPEKDIIQTYHQEIFLEAEIDAHYGIKKIETTLEGIIHPVNGACRLEIPSGINEISEIKNNKV